MASLNEQLASSESASICSSSPPTPSVASSSSRSLFSSVRVGSRARSRGCHLFFGLEKEDAVGWRRLRTEPPVTPRPRRAALECRQPRRMKRTDRQSVFLFSTSLFSCVFIKCWQQQHRQHQHQHQHAGRQRPLDPARPVFVFSPALPFLSDSLVA